MKEDDWLAWLGVWAGAWMGATTAERVRCVTLAENMERHLIQHEGVSKTSIMLGQLASKMRNDQDI